MMNRYKILIVDDEAENIRVMTEYFESLCPEYILIQTTTAQSAFDLAKRLKVDVVISDWQMPGMTGIDLVKAIKAEPLTAHIPVIIVSGVMISEADLQEALDAGAHDYLRKPVERTELVARTNSAINIVKMHLNQLAVKNAELTEKSLLIARENEFHIQTAKRLKQIESLLGSSPKALDMLQELYDLIEQKTRDVNWEHFEIAFHNLYPDFTKTLTEKFPCITPAELRLCILIRLGLSNKDISSLLYLSPDSLKVARSRLRKKLQITTDENLQTFLALL